MKYTCESKYTYKGEVFSFGYIKNPTLSQKMTIVKDVVDGVINEINGYNPILFDYFLVVSIIDNLTDIKMPESFVLSSEFISESNITPFIKEKINGVKDIISAAEKEIEFAKQQIANKSSIDGLIETLTVLINKYGEMFENLNIDEFTENIAKIATISDMPKTEIISNLLKLRKTNKTDIESK